MTTSRALRRREFVALVGAVAAWPGGTTAQPARTPVVGYLGSETPELFASRLASFRRGLAAVGFEDGRNVAIEFRWARGRNETLPALAAELVRRKVDVLATPGSLASALAARAATGEIPIVFETGADPVEAGLVASLAHPGANVTGVTSLNSEVGPKRLQLLHEIDPSATAFALLVNPGNPRNAEASRRALETAARALGLRLDVLEAADERAVAEAFAALDRARIGGLVVANDTFYAARSAAMGALALRHRLPAVHQSREFAAAGGLMGYGGDVAESHAQAGTYVGRVLKGERPATLPIYRVTRTVFILNLKTARELSLAIPPSMAARADEVIE